MKIDHYLMSSLSHFRVLNNEFYVVNTMQYADSTGIYASKEKVHEAQQTHLLPKASPLKASHPFEFTEQIYYDMR